MKKPQKISNLQAKKIMSCDNETVRVACRIMYETGLRVSDTLQLTMENIKSGSVIEKKTKKKKELKLSDETLKEIGDLTFESKRGLLFRQKRNPNWAMNRSTLYKALKEVADQLGIKVSPHSFRHLYAQNIYAVGHNVEMVRKALQHKYIETTLNYLNLEEDETGPEKETVWDKIKNLIARFLKF